MALPERWTQLAHHPEQQRLIRSEARWRVVAAGRRSGKTEIAKRHLVYSCMDPPIVDGPTFVACAPVRDQAKRIFWDDLKELSPKQWVSSVSESELTIHYRTGARLMVVGLDRPQRVEGIPIDGAVVDEIDECRPTAWTSSLRPALSTRGRPGWCWFIGRPKGRKLLWHLFEDAKVIEGWESFHWKSVDIIGEAETEAARRDLDPRSFQQEYEAAFLSQTGLVFYCFDPNKHLRPVVYNPALPLVFSLDFNVKPGSAVALQEQDLPPWNDATGQPIGTTCVVGEVYVPDSSQTEIVCGRLGALFAGHTQPVLVYGDPSGKHRDTRGPGNDWDIVRQHLGRYFPDIRMRVPSVAPPVVDSSNSVNTRMENAAGLVRFAINPKKAPQTLLDIESVCWQEGKPDRQIDKDDEMRTHWCLAAGTMVAADRSSIPIEQIQVGDLVQTRRGLRLVAAMAQTGFMVQVMRCVTTSGRVLRATANHPVWVDGRGFVRMDQLQPGDQLCQNPSNRYCGTDSLGGGTQTPQIVVLASTSRAGTSGCTLPSGRMHMAQLRRGSTSTTRMTIQATTSWRTWSASSRASTEAFTARTGGEMVDAARLGLPPFGVRQNGIAASRAEHGIASMRADAPRGWSEPEAGRSTAGSVESPSSAKGGRRSTPTAPTTVEVERAICRESTTRREIAPSAVLRSSPTGTQRPSAAAADAVLFCRIDPDAADVFDLTVDDAHEFFANGILVSNCDSLRYYVHEKHPIGGVTSKVHR